MTVDQEIYNRVTSANVHPKEQSRDELKLPDCFVIIEEDDFYKMHKLVIEDMKAVYNAAVKDCSQRIKDEYSFLPDRDSGHIGHLIKIIERNMINM